MLDRAQMQEIIAEALRELDLDYRTATLFEPSDRSVAWCIDFLDHAAPQFERTFQVCLECNEGSTYDSVKSDLKTQLAARVG